MLQRKRDDVMTSCQGVGRQAELLTPSVCGAVTGSWSSQSRLSSFHDDSAEQGSLFSGQVEGEALAAGAAPRMPTG